MINLWQMAGVSAHYPSCGIMGSVPIEEEVHERARWLRTRRGSRRGRALTDSVRPARGSRNDSFLVSIRPTGEILLTPLASIPKRELLIWEDEELRASLLRGLPTSRRVGSPRRPPRR